MSDKEHPAPYGRDNKGNEGTGSLQNNGSGNSDINNMEPEGGKKESRKKVVLDYVLTLAIAAGIGLFLTFFVLVNAVIPSGSMENTIMTGDRVFGFRLAYAFSEPSRYDIVIFKYPDNESQLFIKRIIGLPGETVVINHEGEVYIIDSSVDTTGVDDEKLMENPLMFGSALIADDSFCPETPLGGENALGEARDGVFRVPEGSYFMLGDNRNNSRDSRFWTNKYVEKDKILGKAFLVYWPLNEIKLLGYSS